MMIKMVKSSFLVIVSALIVFSSAADTSERAFLFQGSNNLSNESRALIYLKPDLLRSKSSGGRGDPQVPSTSAPDGGEAPTVVSDLSVCLWAKVHYFRQTSSYVFSYATSDAKNNELNFGITYDRILIAVGGKYVYGTADLLFIPYTWYHFCFVANSEDCTGTFYINGEVDKVNVLTPRSILVNGSLVLGQETDRVDGGYQELQSFCGTLTGFNLYSRSLNASEVSSLASCLPDVPEGDLVAWSKAVWAITGPVTVETIQREEYCIHKNFSFVIFPKKRTQKEAHRICRSLKSTVALPGNPEEHRLLYQASEPFVDVCQPHNHATVFMWLGATRDQNGTWTRQNGDPVTYSNFIESPSRPCVGLMVPPNREEWRSISCSSTYQFCTACQEEEERPVVLRMRGLCESYLHETFFKMEDQFGEMPLFRGFTKYNIVYDNNGTWFLLDVWTGKTLAKFLTYDNEIPFGKRTWWTATNFDICEKPSNTSLQLTLSACYEWEYTCDDGSCVNLSQRCDLRVDCPDNSDEVGCDKLWKPLDYLGALPPPGTQPGSALLVNASLAIHGFSEINIRDMKLKVDFTMRMRWSDARLRYKNLSPLSDLNYIEPNSVWVPRVELLNAEFPKTFTTDPLVNIVRLSGPEEDDPSRIYRDEVYEGSTNSMELTQRYNAPFSCTMDMRNFPFDNQHCQLLVRFSSAREFMEWNDLSTSYLGKELLAEYIVKGVTIQKATTEDYSLIVVDITFSRRYGYYLTSAYLPTIMLMIISYASLFCKKENCDLRVMMALTTLLVLYALYQQISDDLPRTSYTKAIDVWCFFSITFIFSQVILHVFVNLKIRRPCLAASCRKEGREVVKRGNKEVKSIRIPPGQETLQNNPNLEITRERKALRPKASNGHVYQCNLLDNSRVFYLVLFGIFCVIYWSVVLTSE